MNEDKATRYHRLKRRLTVLSVTANAAVLGIFVWSGASTAASRLARQMAGGESSSWDEALAVPIYVAILSILLFVAATPFAFYDGFVLERRYGLSLQTRRNWLLDQLKGAVVSLVLAMLAGSLVYACIRIAPGVWWLLAGILCAALVAGLTNLAPVLLLPLLYRVKPIGRDSLRERLMVLANRAGARVLGAYEWGLGEKTRKANAVLAGLGSTRRILVSDTMLADYSDDEIEIVLAHELAHHIHGDIWKMLAFEGCLLLGGFYAAARALESAVPALGLRGPADLAGLPVLLLAAGAVSLLAVPLAHLLSRTFERSADRFALELTRNPHAFISAMRRLAAQNMAEDRPSRIVQWLFYSHPPVAERIEAARMFEA